MSNPDAAVEAVRQWLSNEFPEARVDTQGIFDRETQLFRIHTPTGRPPELEVSREVLEHGSPEAIVRELVQSDTLVRMKRDPSVRIQYFSSGINHFETRYVRCDGRQYRVVRDDKHNVKIFDSRDRTLANTPREILVLPTSAFQVEDSEWCRRIRTWRGEDQ